jgi:hypothetical protein
MIEEAYRLWEGKPWQEFALALLAIKHGEGGFQPIPDAGGDGGIEAWAGDGTAYQCYAAEGQPETKALAGRQKDKMSADIKKFIENSDLLSALIRCKIKKWILLVPRVAGKDVIRFANGKTEELRKAVKDRNLTYADPEIEIWVHGLEMYQAELAQYKHRPSGPARYAAPWAQAVSDSPLWDKTEGAGKEALRAAAIAQAAECWTIATAPISADDRGTDGAGPENRWIDRAAPERAALALADLVAAANLTPPLNPVETALVLTAPFLRAAAVASAESWAFAEGGAAASPLCPDPDGAATSPMRRALRVRWQKQPHITRRVAALRSRGKPEDAEDVAWWLLRRAVCGDPGLWRRRSEQGFLDDEAVNRLAEALFGAAPALETLALIKSDRFVFARFVGADDDRLRGAWGRGGELSVTTSLPPDLRGNIEEAVRPRLLTALLALAGKQALEPLELGTILVDHIGLSEPLSPEETVAQARAAHWGLVNSALKLQAQCRHPALDAALCEQVRAVDALGKWLITQATDWTPPGTAIALPGFVEALAAAPDKSAKVKRDETPPALYERTPVRFTMDAEQVKELLMGAQLYGDPELAIRELYQNALDACRYRRAREQYLERTEAHSRSQWEGKIEIEQGVDAAGRPFIECRDNGVGMDEHVLLSCFARAGKRFTDTDEYLEERADWDAVPDGKIELWPNSRFGIGVFSYFMLADEIRIVTRRFDRDGDEGDVLTVSISGSGSLFRVRRNVERRGAGTTIRLYLSQTEVKVDDKAKDISVAQFLNDNLIVAEFPVQVSQGGEKISWPGDWAPRRDYAEGKLIRSSDQPTVYWWSPERIDLRTSIGNKILLNDGIRIDKKPGYRTNVFDSPGPVCNLFGRHSPVLTADRQKILQNNSALVSLRVNGADCPFGERGDFPFYTLASLAEKYPKAAQRVLENLIREGMNILPAPKMRERWGEEDAAYVDISLIGVCGADKVFFDVLRNFENNTSKKEIDQRREEIDRIYPKKLQSIRSSYFVKFTDAPEKLLINTAPSHEDNGVLLFVSPLDALLISMKFDGEAPWLEGAVSPAHILRAAQKFGELISAVVARLRRLAPLGVKLPDIDEATLSGFTVDERDLKLLSEDLDGLAPWLEGAVSPAHILSAAQKFGELISAVIARLRRLAPLGVKLPDIDEATLSGFTVDERDLKLLSGGLNGVAPWLEGAIPAAHILRAAQKFGEPISAVLARLRRLAPLGVILPDIDEAALAGLTVDELDLRLLSRDLDGVAPWLEGVIPARHILRATQKFGEPIGAVVARLRRLAPLGVKLPDIDEAVLGDFTVDERDLKLLSRDLDSRAPWLEGVIPAGHILRAAEEFGEPISVIVARLRRLAPLGVAAPTDEEMAAWQAGRS